MEMEMEIHLYADQNRNGRPILGAWFKSPLSKRFDCLLIQSVTKVSDDMDVVWVTVHAYDRSQNHCSFDLRLSRFL